MKNHLKRGLYLLVLTLCYYQGFSQTDTLCSKKTYATINLTYGNTYNAFNTNSQTDVTAGQSMVSIQNMINAKYKVGMGAWTAWQLPPSIVNRSPTGGNFGGVSGSGQGGLSRRCRHVAVRRLDLIGVIGGQCPPRAARSCPSTARPVVRYTASAGRTNRQSRR